MVAVDRLGDVVNTTPTADSQSAEQRGLARRFARWAVKRYYPRTEIAGGERIPQDGPVLLSCTDAVPDLVEALDDPTIEVSAAAWDALRALTRLDLPHDARAWREELAARP